MTDTLPTMMLTQEHIAVLRDGYQAETMKAASKGAVVNRHSVGGAYVVPFVDILYNEDLMSGKDRERCLIALLSTNGDVMTLSVHIYWGLMEGLSLEGIAQTLMLAGGYTGIATYVKGLMTMEKACASLAALIDEDPSANSSTDVLKHLIATLG